MASGPSQPPYMLSPVSMLGSVVVRVILEHGIMT